MEKYKWYIAAVAIMIISSCQKVINIDLNSASPAIVIEANINDQPGPYSVVLSQTVNFSDPNTFPAVNGAFVTIADNAGTTDTLFETAILGTYNTKKIVGVPGRTYTLTVIANGKTYTSVSTMPQAVTFDTLIVFKFQRTSFGKGGGTADTAYIPEALFQDPPTGMHYYRFVETVNDTIETNINVLDDQLSQGKYITDPIRHRLNEGDSVKVEMQCIDNGTYQYFSTFGEASGSTNVTPANPISNISNGALGYFSAHTSRFRSIYIN